MGTNDFWRPKGAGSFLSGNYSVSNSCSSSNVSNSGLSENLIRQGTPCFSQSGAYSEILPSNAFSINEEQKELEAIEIYAKMEDKMMKSVNCEQSESKL